MKMKTSSRSPSRKVTRARSNRKDNYQALQKNIFSSKSGIQKNFLEVLRRNDPPGMETVGFVVHEDFVEIYQKLMPSTKFIVSKMPKGLK